MSTPAKPSPGALRAARIIMTADDPARFAADFAAEQEQTDLAEIIDRETNAGELAAQLLEMVGLVEWTVRNYTSKGSARAVIWTKRTEKARATLAAYNAT